MVGYLRDFYNLAVVVVVIIVVGGGAAATGVVKYLCVFVKLCVRLIRSLKVVCCVSGKLLSKL